MKRIILVALTGVLACVGLAQAQALGALVNSAKDVRPAPRPASSPEGVADVLRTRSGNFQEAAKSVSPRPMTLKDAAAVYRLEKGEPIHEGLMRWADKAGWQLLWYPARSWEAIGNADFSDKGDVTAAVEAVIAILREEGRQVRLHISGNHIMEVFSTEVRYGND